MTADLVPISSSLLARLAALDIDVERVLRQASVARSRFEPAKAQLTTKEFFAFWRAVEDVSQVRDVGLRIGAEVEPHHYNVAFVAALHAPTLGEALEKIARYKRLVCPEDVSIRIVRGEARLGFEWLLAESVAPVPLIDGAFAGIVELARRGTNKRITPKRIELARRSGSQAALSRYFGCEIHFGKRQDLLVFDEAALAEPFVTRNADLLAMVVPGLEAELGARRKRTLVDDVRGVLGRRIHGERPHVEAVAKELGMSSRTMQRRLEDFGTSYQALLDEVRRTTARRLLSSTDLDAGEVAFLLGFEELNSFTRAFRSWEGTTPLRFRATSLPKNKKARQLQ